MTSSNDELPHILIQSQLKDVIMAQQQAYVKLKQKVDAQGKMVPLENYEAVLKELESEKAAHAKVKADLMDAQDKLEFALGEIEVLKKQIEREKTQFGKTFGLLKTKALNETVKNVGLASKCDEIEKKREKQQDVLSEKEKVIDNLSQKLREQDDNYRHKLTELNIQMQQDMYIAKTMAERDKRSGKIHNLDKKLR